MAAQVVFQEPTVKAIADAIRGKVGSSESIAGKDFASLIEGIKSGIKATAGSFMLANDTNRYVLTHNLGEVPFLFFIGTDTIFNTSNTGSKTYLFIGSYGFSEKDY